jgi:acyl transferase domain-containing protein/SAM-dependent methyltransferase
VAAARIEARAMADLSAVKQALLEIRRLRARLAEAERPVAEPVAIVGLGCRFPGGASDPEAFWALLREGVDAVTEIPRERWDVEAYYDADPDAPGRTYARHGAFVGAVDQFDAGFFGITPREAAGMDPQHRLLLEVAWEALEHAGQAPDRLVESRTGVFVGISSNDYGHLQAQSMPAGGADAYFTTGTVHSVAAGRLAYLLGLRGPALSVDTACSSSLVAVHLACQSLRQGECDTALAGGVNVILWPELMVNFTRARMISPTGRCHTFDAEADGYVRGEGCGVVVLKRLSDALAAGHTVLAVIRGSAVNQDGRTSGLTVPNGPAQEALIREALAHARVEPAAVSYVEAHGTGTSLGDPIEVRALAGALGAGRPTEQPLAIGSVKTNIGHLEAAAGVASLIKVTLALQHGELPASLHFKTPNPHIPWADLPVEVLAARRPWTPGGAPRLAGVSSFGFSGTNAHVILEEAPVATAVEGGERPAYLLPLSAKSGASLQMLAGRMARHLAAHPEQRLADVCFSAATGRAHLPHRAVVIGREAGEIAARLDAVATGREADGVLRGSGRLGGPPQVAFLFTGQGAQYPGMGRRLYEVDPAFRAALDACAAALDPYLDRPLREIIAAGPAALPALDEALYAQPAMFAIEYALAAMWRARGVEPVAVIGHSLGEYAAACVAGVLDLADAAQLVALRGRVMESLDKGAMAAVWASESEVAGRLAAHAGRVTIAALNAPGQVVVSGVPDAVHAVCRGLEADGVRVRHLTMTHAFHSPMVEPALGPLGEAAARIQHHAPRLAVVSNVTGRLAGPGEIDAAYWARHARQPVRFAEGLAALRAEGIDVFLEVGPHPTLLALGPQCVSEEATWVGTLRRDEDDWTCVLEALGALYTRGVDVDWSALERGLPRRRVALPPSPFQRVRHWAAVGPQRRREARASAAVWEAVVAAGRRQMAQGPLDLALASYPARWSCLDRLAVAYAAAALVELGCFGVARERHTLAALAERLSLPPARRHLVARWLGHLVAAGLLRRDGEDFVSAAPLPADPSAALADARAALADVPGLMTYVERCGGRLAGILTGAESPLDTLFPDGTFETADFLYDTWPVARYMNALVRATVEAWVQAQPDERALRVLEVGAGSGGTTAAVLPALPADRTRYTYTDVSPFFLAHGERKFREFGFVRTGRLDIERDPVEQGHEAASVHLVIAANVLHATQDLDRTLEHVRGLLAPGGMLVAYEATRHHVWYDVTTGLIEGWHRFADGWREDDPLLSPARWETALRAHGFERIAAFPDAASPADVLGLHVIVALAPGVTPSDLATADPAAGLPAEAAMPDEVVAGAGSELRGRLQAAPPAEHHDILVAHVREVVARVIRIDAPESLDRRGRLMDLGIDSLMALELRKRLGAGLGLARPLPATLVFDHPSIDAIATLLAREMDGGQIDAGGVEATPAAPAPRLAVDDVEALDDRDVEALLLKRLERMR